ncbi:MAG: hypothetical protein B7Y59_12650 [Burkholderiales bacterium 35-55-47]|jgi:acyl carrier protein|nr:MAG: hypothetical protein B7Y59_12650 [Burkholderiales bacterium 35-55-47]OZA98925.1 MAG: hypothetical protein B7X62_12635 [Burkholderiales bacterium 39-55-53]
MYSIDDLIKVIDKTGVVGDIGKFDPHKSFRDNGIDSLEVFAIFLAIEEEYKIKINEEDSMRISTLGQLLVFLNSHVSS